MGICWAVGMMLSTMLDVSELFRGSLAEHGIEPLNSYSIGMAGVL